MKRSRKEVLQENCKKLLTYNYSDGGIASYNEYNQVLCDLTPDLVKYLTIEGLEYLNRELQNVYDNMPEFDKH